MQTIKLTDLYADNSASTSDLIDQLGVLKAQISDLQKVEKDIKGRLIERGIDKAQGALYRVTISRTKAEHIDTAKVRKYAPKWLLAKIVKTVERTTVRVTAKRTS